MKIDINQFWNLLTESQLVNVSQVQTLFSEFSNESKSEKTVGALTKWLIEKKAISPYQAEIITAGHSGPFRFGNYTVLKRIKKGVLKGHFAGRHTKSSYPVLLQFFPGSESKDLKAWALLESNCSKLEKLEHPNIATIFESIVTPNYRFVVSQYPSGPSLSEKLPAKARLPWKKACAILAQTANGLDAMHQAGIVHNAVSPRAIWLDKKGQAQLRFSPFPDVEFEGEDAPEEGKAKVIESKHDYLAPECYDPSSPNSAATDIYSLGCTLFRAITGRSVFPAKDLDEKRRRHENEKPGDSKKYEVPTELESLLQKMLAKQPKDRPKTVSEIANLLGLLSGKSDAIKSQKISTSTSKKAYLQSISQFLPGSEVSVKVAPEIATVEEQVSITPADSQAAAEDRAARIQAAQQGIQNRKKGKWKIPVAIAASLLALSGIIGLLAMSASQTVVKKIPIEKEETTDPTIPSEPVTKQKSRLEELAELPPEQRPIIYQELIEDNGSVLWESPTEGAPAMFDYMPVAPRVIFHFRVAELTQQPEGILLMKSLGPEFESRTRQFIDDSGLELDEIEQLTVSLHSIGTSEYEPCFQIKTTEIIELEQLVSNWNQPAVRTLDNQQTIYESGSADLAYYMISQPHDAESNEEADIVAVQRFVFGSKKIVEDVALSAGSNVLSGALRNLAELTDSNRHFNMLWLRNSLFNDEGQNLMGPNRSTFNRQLSILTPDDIRAGLLSLHIDNGSYFELVVDRNFDIKADQLKEQLENEFRSHRNSLTSLVAQIPPSPYWDNVRLRYDNMLTDINRNLRWSVEHGNVMANCWLSPMAAHNLIAASDLVISFSTGASSTPAVTRQVPKTIEELLEKKRDLVVANPPDLNVLLADLQAEVIDDSGRLPFQFNIRLLGGDLEKEGITKNQRPSELILENKSLAEILTSIMVKANPDKDITGPEDPNCKLIWVIADDPENAGEKAILVTTRVAASEKSYSLPPAFRSDN